MMSKQERHRERIQGAMGTNGGFERQVWGLRASPDLVWLELDTEDGDSWLCCPGHRGGRTWLVGGSEGPGPED